MDNGHDASAIILESRYSQEDLTDTHENVYLILETGAHRELGDGTRRTGISLDDRETRLSEASIQPKFG